MLFFVFDTKWLTAIRITIQEASASSASTQQVMHTAVIQYKDGVTPLIKRPKTIGKKKAVLP
ncbi:hypothetical protein BsIDN1_59770 [Bacillus safensis]|uniref:Uncharacterized protein n=1 Tax=Bacillus safensis TaxID=561879 RepID=A0A5S9MKH2_BACIA|nr:hypothetical protein BsIDN1_59770 [Bacillus safensis]